MIYNAIVWQRRDVSKNVRLLKHLFCKQIKTGDKQNQTDKKKIFIQKYLFGN